MFCFFSNNLQFSIDFLHNEMPEKIFSFIMHIIITTRYLVTIVIRIENKIGFHISLHLIIKFWEKLRKYGKNTVYRKTSRLVFSDKGNFKKNVNYKNGKKKLLQTVFITTIKKTIYKNKIKNKSKWNVLTKKLLGKGLRNNLRNLWQKIIIVFNSL